MPRHGRPWDDEEREMLAAGKPIPGRSERSCRDARKRLRAKGVSCKIRAMYVGGRWLDVPERKAVYEALWPDVDALQSLWPHLSRAIIIRQAARFGVREAKPVGSRASRAWKPHEDAVLIECGLDLDAAVARLPGRTYRAARGQRDKLISLGKIEKSRERGHTWTADEIKLLRAGKDVPGRTRKQMHKKRWRLGFTLKDVRAVRADDGKALRDRIARAVPAYLPKHIRDDVIAQQTVECLEGRCGITSAEIKVGLKESIKAVNKLHPQYGAPASLDQPFYDNGGGTRGDRIESDRFHF